MNAPKVTDYSDGLRRLLAALDSAHKRASVAVKPKVGARRSIVRADLHDRAVGLTAPDEVTPAVGLGYRYGFLRGAR